MKAVVQDRYGPPEVLRVEDVERPAPKDDEVLIRIRATTVTQTDTHLRKARPVFWRLLLGLRRPRRRILGVELAGEVEAVGPAVTQFKVGDDVFGTNWFGAHAEFICLRESAALAQKPACMAPSQTAAASSKLIPAGRPGVRPYSFSSNSRTSSGRRCSFQVLASRTGFPLASFSGSGRV